VFPVIDVDPLDPLAGPTFGGPFCRGFFTFAIDDSPILHVAVRAAARRAVQRIVKAGAQAAFVSSVSGVFVSRLRIWQKKMPNAICQLFFGKDASAYGQCCRAVRFCTACSLAVAIDLVSVSCFREAAWTDLRFGA
jgi:hypothetical protein